MCASHFLPSPSAARFIYMFISLRRHIHFYSLCFQVYLCASERTHQISRGTHTRVFYRTPPGRKLRYRCGFQRLGKVRFGIRRGTQVPLPFRRRRKKQKQKTPVLLRRSFTTIFLTSGASWELKAESRNRDRVKVGEGGGGVRPLKV